MDLNEKLFLAAAPIYASLRKIGISKLSARKQAVEEAVGLWAEVVTQYNSPRENPYLSPELKEQLRKINDELKRKTNEDLLKSRGCL